MFSYLTCLPMLIYLIAEIEGEENSPKGDLQCYSGNMKSFSNKTCKGDNPITHCYYNSTILEKSLTFKPKEERIPIYSMSCDYTSICEKYNATENTFTQIESVYENSTVNIYCCKENNCNKPEIISKRLCYNAYKKNNISEGTIEQCKSPSSLCIKISNVLPSTTDYMEYFSCDENLGNRSIIAECQAVSDSQPKCFRVMLNGTQLELCCCYGDLCMNTTYKTQSDSMLSFNATELIEMNDNVPSIHPLKKENSTDWIFVGGLISAGVFILLILITAVVIGLKCRKKKETSRMMLSYTRLAADATPEDEDVRMLSA